MPDECLTFGVPRLRGLAPPEGGTPNKYQLRYPTAAGFRSEFRVYADATCSEFRVYADATERPPEGGTPNELRTNSERTPNELRTTPPDSGFPYASDLA